MVLREAFFGVRRFVEIQRNLGIARNTLTNRLTTLVRKGVLERRRYQEGPDRFHYRLTEKGLDLYPIIVTLMQWGDRWLAGESGPPLKLFHKSNGHLVRPVIRCVHCGIEVKARDVHYEAGPGALRPVKRQDSPQRFRWRGPTDLDMRPCSVAKTLSILLDHWAFLVLREAFFGVHRFDELQSNLGISRSTLAKHLKSFVRHGIFELRCYHEHPKRFEYRLVDKGLDLYPVTLALIRFGDCWLGDESGPPLILFHKQCGHPIDPEVTCVSCGIVIKAREVRYEYTGGSPRMPKHDVSKSGSRGASNANK